ncbi:MAG: fused response regulator/phosphatase [Armatimonadota bacterium]
MQTTAASFRHDLRTSVGHVIGYSEMLIEDASAGGYEDLLPDLERVWNAGRKALALLDTHLGKASQPHSDGSAIREAGSTSISVTSSVSRQQTGGVRGAEEPQPSGQVLIVDDDAENRFLLARQLTAQGHANVAVADGESALRVLGEQSFDVVLLDLMMPGIDGFETLRRIKADPALQHLPVLMISAREDAETVVSCIEAGALDYLTKPFNPVLLQARVGASLRAKRLRDREEQLLSEVRTSLERERRIADALQRSLVREIAPGAFANLRVASRYEAAWTEAQIGGDLFDAFRLPSGPIAFAVADASGKGLDAAARVAQVKYALRAYAREAEGETTSIAGRLNDFLCDSDVNTENTEPSYGGSFVTLALALVDPTTGQTDLLSAGCEPPLILRAATGKVDSVEISGPPLGVLAGIRYDSRSCRLEPGDILLLYTDGITEARSGSEFFGVDGLSGIACASRDRWSDPDIHPLAEALLEGARTFGQGSLRDDACLLLVRREQIEVERS